VKFPEPSVVVVAVAVPVRLTVTPLTMEPLTEPETENVGMEVDVKFCPDTLAPFTVTD